MIAFAIAVAAAASVPSEAASDPPLAWSPSGDWIAFAVLTRPVDRALGRFPLFPAPEEDREGDPIGAQGGATTYRVWAVRVGDGRAIKVSEGTGPITSPCWGPDGRAVAFGRVVEAAGEGPRSWEVVLSHGDESQVITRTPLGPGELRAAPLITEAVDWDRGGKLIAVPDPRGMAVELIDTDRGEVQRRLEGGRLASFSPIGGRLAFFRARGDGWELVETRTDAGPEADRPIDLVDRADQPPVWTSDGQAILYLKQGPPTAEGVQTRLFCERFDGNGPRAVKEVENPSNPGDPIRGAYLTIGADGFDQYFVVQYAGPSSAIAYHRGSHPIDRINPFGDLGMFGAPILSPDGSSIAVRFGGPGPTSLPGLIDPATKRLTPIAPDDESKAAWISSLTEAAGLSSSPVDRPTVLPFASELEGPEGSSSKFKRLAELGGRLADGLAESSGARPLTRRPALVFSYLAGDYDAADRALDAIAAESRTPDHALRALGLRAQLALARGNDAEAREMIEFILRQHPARIARVESDGGGGIAVTPEPSAASSWPEALWRQHRDRLGTRPGGEGGLAPPDPEPDPPGSPFDDPFPSGPDRSPSGSAIPRAAVD